MAGSNPVTIVTGASSGIGRATARALAVAGHHVGLIARRHDLLDALADEIRSTGGTAHVAPADVGDRPSLHAAIATIAEALGPIDVLVANAGFAVRTPIDPMDIDDFETTFRVNILGVVYAIEAVLPAMLRRRSGHLVAISSLAAYKGLPGESAYCASKSAVNAFMESLRIDLRKRGVEVTTVCPGFVDTPMNTMDTAAKPFQISAEAAAMRIARVVARGRSGVVRFPRPMAWITDLIARLPDSVVARLVGHGPEPIKE